MSYAQNIPMLKLKCKDAGFDCKFVAKGKTEEEIMQKAVEHAMKDHGMKPEDMTSEMKEKIRSHIHKSLF
jgi:predicted small metal-binding protein